MKKSILFLSLAIMFFAFSSKGYAKEYVIRMVTHAEEGQYAFEPRELTIKSGDTVTWVNAQDDMHNVMAESVPEGVDSFSSPMLEQNGQKWSYTFTKSGTYAFHCHPHAELGMKGTVIVDHPSVNGGETKNGHHHGEKASESIHHDSHDVALDGVIGEKQAIHSLKEGRPVYSCPMHTHVFSDVDGKCPVCGMNLKQVTEVENGQAVFGKAEPEQSTKKQEKPE